MAHLFPRHHYPLLTVQESYLTMFSDEMARLFPRHHYPLLTVVYLKSISCGRVLPEQWVFGGICRETKDSFVFTVLNSTGSTFLNKIIENIEDGSTIYSDSWKGYQTNRIEIEGFIHAEVNHKYNFIDPDTGIHTQTVERMWGSAKWRNKRQRGTATSFGILFIRVHTASGERK
ncbi:DDE_Tnp_IS1595 domain-containing protein [Caerostris darwini]|uniref:DDE_Tnp_IS1595 domain-containing protein n=1 Tax=Caerostris darwini TaxID=1538125 RepID=A0AAV4PDL6_9ARAC|nr:DDE_Tnp_IS1595 domain-containing protein [Caerostris darwini]